MICKNDDCTNGKVRCIATRASRAEPETYRTYECQHCGTRMITKEVFESFPMSDMELEQFRLGNLKRARREKLQTQWIGDN